jgi:hypothetical protein
LVNNVAFYIHFKRCFLFNVFQGKTVCLQARKKIVPIVSIVFKPPQAKAVLALDVVACQSKKRAIIAC